MSAADPGLIREVLREVLAELLPEVVAQAAPRIPNGNGGAPGAEGGEPPQVPAPPVAAVHRPSTWRAPPGAAPAPAVEAEPAGGDVEQVAISTDAELEAFVRRLLHLYENPRDRMAIRSGRLRFALRRPQQAASSGPARQRIEKGAVTERIVAEAAAAGAGLLLGRRAVLTPMARDRARALGVSIEKER